MRFHPALGNIRSVTTGVIFGRGAVVATFTLAQRFLAPAMAWVLFEQSLAAKVGVGLALSVVFTVNTLVTRVFFSQTEANLLQRTAAAVLESNVLKARVGSGEDLHAEVNHAIYMTTQAVAQILPSLAGDLVACAALGVWVVVVEPPRLVLVAATLTVVAAAGLFVSRRSVERAATRAWRLQAHAYETFLDIVDGRLEVVASGHRASFLSRLHDRAAAWGNAGAAVAAYSALAGRLPLLAVAVLVGVALAVSSSLRDSVNATLAEVAVFASVTPAFAAVAQGVHGLAKAECWLEVVARILRSAQPASSGVRVVGDIAGSEVVFEQISFRYEGQEEEALHGVSFASSCVGTVALAGANGSGKSTCLRLLLALAKPATGRITVGGEPLESLDPDVWRRQTVFLPQRPYLPARCEVGDAVRWLDPGVSRERIRQSLDRVGLLASLERRGDDPLGVRIDTLSIGERQRVALARILCRDAALYLLDEPDANLDRAGIAVVADLLRDLGRRHLVVVAAHTPELLDAADRVLTLDRGRIVGDSLVVQAVDRRAGRV